LSTATNQKFGKFLGSRLSPEERREALENLFVFGRENQRPFLIRMAVLLLVSTVIASCGLLSDSAAVVIGAMLVAPLMRPVMAAAAAITLGWSRRLYNSLLLTLVMAVTAVAIAVCITYIAPHMITIPTQVIARTKPTFFDLVIALAAGAGGAYVITRKEASSIPGVAIAVALLPPLASCGILFVFQENEMAMKAFVLFFTNFAAMVMAGALTFMAVGISPDSTRRRSARLIRNSLIIFTLLVVAVSVPLYFYSTEVWYDATYQANQSEEMQAWLAENELVIDHVKFDYEKRIIYMHLLGPDPPLDIGTLYDEIVAKRERETGKKMKPFRIEVGWTQQARFSWPPLPGEGEKERRLRQDYSRELSEAKWYWIGTQYADGNWLRPVQEHSYYIQSIGDKTFMVLTSCGERTGTYELHQESIAIKIDEAEIDETCPESKIDGRFFDDLKQVINLDHDENRLSFRISNDEGVMYFQRD
jgi:uncharacterized hydrophobic protein (TIGR00271 family)